MSSKIVKNHNITMSVRIRTTDRRFFEAPLKQGHTYNDFYAAVADRFGSDKFKLMNKMEELPRSDEVYDYRDLGRAESILLIETPSADRALRIKLEKLRGKRAALDEEYYRKAADLDAQIDTITKELMLHVSLGGKKKKPRSGSKARTRSTKRGSQKKKNTSKVQRKR